MFLVAGKPVGLSFISYDEGGRASPQLMWFPWASARNKVETLLKFIVELKKFSLVLAILPEDEVPLAWHLGKYGACRFVGRIRNYFGEGNPGTLFQSVG